MTNLMVNGAKEIYDPEQGDGRQQGVIQQSIDIAFLIEAEKSMQKSRTASGIADDEDRLLDLYLSEIGKQQLIEEPAQQNEERHQRKEYEEHNRQQTSADTEVLETLQIDDLQKCLEMQIEYAGVNKLHIRREIGGQMYSFYFWTFFSGR
jgi:hypothetical protein